MRSTALNKLAERPANTLICDGFGVHAAKSPIDSSVYQFHAVCEFSSFGYIASSKKHTIEDWVLFLRSVIVHARSQGHEVQRLRFDRAPELATDKLKERLEKELGNVTKKIALIVDSSMETEVIASAKAGEQVSVDQRGQGARRYLQRGSPPIRSDRPRPGDHKPIGMRSRPNRIDAASTRYVDHSRPGAPAREQPRELPEKRHTTTRQPDRSATKVGGSVVGRCAGYLVTELCNRSVGLCVQRRPRPHRPLYYSRRPPEIKNARHPQ